MSPAPDPIAEGTPPPRGLALALLAATVFLSAFLLFQVQPIIGKYILPWFGATPGVWATTLLFFQLMLLCGYAYAHFLVSRLTWQRQAILHAVLLGLALITLPITPGEGLKPIDADAPVRRILLILTLSVGAPYLLLSATAPLIQRWYAELYPNRSTYRLYALSNFGSLLALLSYPFVVEPNVLLSAQTSLWSVGYVVFAGLCAGCAFIVYGSVRGAGTTANDQGTPDGDEPVQAGKRTRGAAIMWLLLSACGSGLLLATTNQMSMDIAVVPFLWILPLSIYLLTFILTFDHERWYVRPVFIALLPAALINGVRLLHGGIDLALGDQVVSYSVTLFICCMCLHGELARARPTARHLTYFFLVVSIGGAVGGLFVALVSPALFTSFYEYQVLLVACYTLVSFVLARSVIAHGLNTATLPAARGLVALSWAVGIGSIVLGAIVLRRPETWLEGASPGTGAMFAAWQVDMRVYGAVMAVLVLSVLEARRRREGVELRIWWASRPGLARAGLTGTGALGLVALTGGFVWLTKDVERGNVEQDRNFYGTLAIKELDIGGPTHRLSLMHGRIRHGTQLEVCPTWPTMYYGPQTGVGLAIQHHPLRPDPTRQFRMGGVGLGVGTIAAYANARIDAEQGELECATDGGASGTDYMRFYELNPLVTRWARERFTFLDDATGRGADVAVFDGDARIVLERQLEQGDAQGFDVLAVDAFSSDAIPIHLLTLESFETYLAHLNPDGILALHVTNRFVDLIPIVQRLAQATNLGAIHVRNGPSASGSVQSSDWVLLTNNSEFLAQDAVRVDEREMPGPGPLWTDDFSSLLGAVQLGR
jgi:hypothetical protein